jgi:hypothetical protein
VSVPPGLTIGIQAGLVEVSWSDAAAGLLLESTPSLGGATPANWTPVASVANPLTGAGNLQINPTTSPGPRFFRLRTP